MKRGPSRPWPRDIVEVPPDGDDPRADPNATQKISRAELEEALRRTKSGTRPVVRSRPDLEDDFPGPRDDAPEISIVRIDSVEIDELVPPSRPPASVRVPATPLEAAPPSSAPPRALAPPEPPARGLATGARAAAQRLHVTPRVAFVAGVVVSVLVALAVLVGFVLGRG